MSTPERAGWYDDPEDESQLRYFDGIIWSDRTVPRQTHRSSPPVTTDPATGHGAGPSGQPSSAPGTDVFGRRTGMPAGPAAAHPYGAAQGGTQHGGAPYGADGTQTSGTPEPTTADGQTLASYGARVGAYLMDLLIIMIINAVVAGWAWWLWISDYMTFAWDAAMANDPERVEALKPDELLAMLDWKFFFIALGLTLLVQAVYHIGFLTTKSATPGKLMLGLSVRRVDRPGRLSVGTAFMRMLLPLAVGVLSVVPLVSYLLSFVSIADLVWPIKDTKRQALHDKIAGTQVVRGKQPRTSDAQGSNPVRGS